MALSQASKILVSDINSALAGKQDTLGYTPVKTVNNVSPNSAGNVTISTTPTTVKGVLGSAWAANSNSMTLPSGGTWFVWNVYNEHSTSSSHFYYGISKASGKGTGWVENGTFSGGTTLYATKQTTNDGGTSYSATGKLAAIRIA